MEDIKLTENNKDMEKFIYKNTEYYIEKFNKINSSTNKMTWNWSAFWWGNLWVLYRKMYKEAIILILVASFASKIPVVGDLMPTFLTVLLAIYGNAMYLEHVKRNLSEINTFEESKKEFMLGKMGGTNLALTTVLGLMLIAPIIILIFFVMGSLSV